MYGDSSVIRIGSSTGEFIICVEGESDLTMRVSEKNSMSAIMIGREGVPEIIRRSNTYKAFVICRNALRSLLETSGMPCGIVESGSTFKEMIWAIRLAAPSCKLQRKSEVPRENQACAPSLTAK